MFNEGFKAGLKYWLIFLLGFYFLGYRAELSILFGGLGGVAGGFLAAWWQTKELPKSAVETSEPKDNAFTRATRRLGLRKEQEEKSERDRPKWLKRRERRSLKSRR
jgi:hypothetical protein